MLTLLDNRSSLLYQSDWVRKKCYFKDTTANIYNCQGAHSESHTNQGEDTQSQHTQNQKPRYQTTAANQGLSVASPKKMPSAKDLDQDEAFEWTRLCFPSPKASVCSLNQGDIWQTAGFSAWKSTVRNQEQVCGKPTHLPCPDHQPPWKRLSRNLNAFDLIAIQIVWEKKVLGKAGS